ncbi:hypothetical protein [Magnetospirillum sp. UT-4]|uniref:hypothetical protein n=1 Tax=Magnetospirillum sp. UT-4 TaxID=2681467 RepID=UPI0013826090|nr:hypothetical protein [Magnetospirillum sp. UT-4]CAA7618275.1 conserved hypothetical protein [Magnetospirillum sp. UT-4]
MTPILAPFRTALDAYRRQDWAARARAENYLWEERAAAERQRVYEDQVAGDCAADPESWQKAHANFLQGRIYGPDLPETFTPANDLASLDDAVRGLGKKHRLVRIESLDYAVEHSLLPKPLDVLKDYVDIVRGRRAFTPDPSTDVTRDDIDGDLEALCEKLNGGHSYRPRFMGFVDDRMAADLDSPDWADRLRDRLGLGHYRPTAAKPQIPVLAMTYAVKDVDAVGKKLRAAFPLAVPTVLDGDLYEWFFPSPAGLPYGRTLQLDGDADCTAKIAEVLSLRVPYKPEHIHAIGFIGKADAKAFADPEAVRREHLECLRRDPQGRKDFGTP